MKKLVVTLLGTGILASGFFLSTPPAKLDIVLKRPPSDVVVLDQKGEIIHEYRRDYNHRRFAWQGLDSFPEILQRLLIQNEDRRFYSHFGVDIRSLIRAALGSSSGGASTLSMQTANLIYPYLQKVRSRSLPAYKLLQMVLALRLEMSWSKQEILETYLNLAPMRGELVGFPAASRVLFGKHMAGLNKEEAALLIALLPAPNNPLEKVHSRACRILELSTECDIAYWSVDLPSESGNRIRKIPHLAQRVVQKADTYIYTSISAELQEFAQNTLDLHITRLVHENVHDGAVLVVENSSGHILAYVGGSSLSKSPFVDGVQARRQAGSTLKPFLYATAIEAGILHSGSVLNDSPVSFAAGSGIYVPQNYDKQFHGEVTLAQALGSSLNVPAVRTLDLIGEEVFLESLHRLGFSHSRQAQHYGLSLALGSLEVSLFELVRAYSSLEAEQYLTDICASQACKTEGTRQQKLPFSVKTSRAINQILRSRDARTLTFGTNSILNQPTYAAVKTGTSRDMRDNWCIGFTDDYTVGVWVGNYDNQPMQNVSGVSGAAPVWSQIMSKLHPNGFSGRVPRTVRDRPAQANSGQEFTPFFTYPQDGAIIALGADIPHNRRGVMIQVANPIEGFSVSLNGKVLGKAADGLLWVPQSGSHQLSLTNSAGTVFDSLKFTVR